VGVELTDELRVRATSVREAELEADTEDVELTEKAGELV